MMTCVRCRTEARDLHNAKRKCVAEGDAQRARQRPDGRWWWTYTMAGSEEDNSHNRAALTQAWGMTPEEVEEKTVAATQWAETHQAMVKKRREREQEWQEQETAKAARREEDLGRRRAPRQADDADPDPIAYELRARRRGGGKKEEAVERRRKKREAEKRKRGPQASA